jgi:hypothetical protein
MTESVIDKCILLLLYGAAVSMTVPIRYLGLLAERLGGLFSVWNTGILYYTPVSIIVPGSSLLSIYTAKSF